MIHAVLIFNTSGVPRLIKFYSPLRHPAQPLVQKIFSLISTRAPGLCNFLDAPDLNESLRKSQTDSQDARVVYRNYATLFFVFVVDSAESELGILDLIQVFVEALDRAFESVCELDLVFHFDEVHHILSQVVQGGLVLETNVDEISSAGWLPSLRCPETFLTATSFLISVQEHIKTRKTSFQASNPLALGSGGPGGRSSSVQTPIGWLTGKLAGVGAR